MGGKWDGKERSEEARRWEIRGEESKEKRRGRKKDERRTAAQKEGGEVKEEEKLKGCKRKWEGKRKK